MELRPAECDVVASHAAMRLSARDESEAAAVEWSAEAVAPEMGYDGTVDDVVTFLDSHADVGAESGARVSSEARFRRRAAIVVAPLVSPAWRTGRSRRSFRPRSLGRDSNPGSLDYKSSA